MSNTPPSIDPYFLFDWGFETNLKKSKLLNIIKQSNRVPIFTEPCWLIYYSPANGIRSIPFKKDYENLNAESATRLRVV